MSEPRMNDLTRRAYERLCADRMYEDDVYGARIWRRGRRRDMLRANDEAYRNAIGIDALWGAVKEKLAPAAGRYLDQMEVLRVCANGNLETIAGWDSDNDHVRQREPRTLVLAQDFRENHAQDIIERDAHGWALASLNLLDAYIDNVYLMAAHHLDVGVTEHAERQLIMRQLSLRPRGSADEDCKRCAIMVRTLEACFEKHPVAVAFDVTRRLFECRRLNGLVFVSEGGLFDPPYQLKLPTLFVAATPGGQQTPLFEKLFEYYDHITLSGARMYDSLVGRG
ncbi:hypothetical protein HY641_03050 [Candidatus Woesearchaeota archaeon]|nr:hypothetical protein [Candidatus Woesearchaeota archaeon]